MILTKEDDVEDMDKDFSNSFASKILTQKLINPEVFANIMPKIWGVEGRIKIEKSGRNLYLCKCRNQRDKARIWRGNPWSFDDSLIVMEELRGDNSVEELEFRYAFFWVHFHNLPRVCYCRKYTKALGNSIGTFEEAEEDERGRMSGEKMRVKVKIDINEPLKRGTNIQIGSKAERKWVPITYEKLLDFCYLCGKLDHVLQDCEEKEAEKGQVKNYGVNLRDTKGSKGMYKGWKPDNRPPFVRGRGRGRGDFWRKDFRRNHRNYRTQEEVQENQSKKVNNKEDDDYLMSGWPKKSRRPTGSQRKKKRTKPKS